MLMPSSYRDISHGAMSLKASSPAPPKYSHERVDEGWYAGGMKAIQIASLTPRQSQALDHL
jgi:hypothetical protein